MTADRLLGLARAWFAADIVTRVFEPLIADWQSEHQTLRGLARARSMLQVWTCIAITAALMMPWQLKQRLAERVTLGGWIATECFVVIGLFAQWYLFFDANPRAASSLLPALVGIALPLALIPAAFVVWRLGPPVEARTMMLRLTLLSMLVLAPTLAWWLPSANQAWRVAQAGEAVQRGSRELTLADMLRPDAPANALASLRTDWSRARQHALLERASVWLMPITMSLLGLAVASAARRGWLIVGLASWLCAGGLWLTLLDVSPFGAHAVLIAVTVSLNAYDRRSTAIVC